MKSGRRHEARSDAPDRRSFPRPPLWLNLLLLILGIGGLLFARYHRDKVSTDFSDVLTEQQRTPLDARKVKDELAAMDLSRAQLKQELEGRMKFLTSLKSDDFYLSVDTQARKLRFYYGSTVLREGDIVLGEAKTVQAPSGTFTFVPVKGSFAVQEKLVDADWKVPDWVFVLNGSKPPAELPTVKDGLGKYVIALPDGYVIHSKPSENSPLKGPKPGSVMASEQDLAAIWPRVHRGTQVYIF